MNDDVINKESRKTVCKRHDDVEKWKNYSQRMAKHPYVKQYLLDKYDNICQYCGWPIRGNMHVHHIDYDKECWTDQTIRIAYSTPKRPNGTRKVPDCEHCDRFHECVDDSVVPVHPMCNLEICKAGAQMRRQRNKEAKEAYVV